MPQASPVHLPLMLPQQHSQARRFSDLRSFVLDNVADALHQSTALHGAVPCLRLLVSRRCLVVPLPMLQAQLDELSSELRRFGVPHSVHQVLPGDEEPATHQLNISFYN